MQTLKVVVVGDSNVGKTSLLRTYTEGSFPGEYVTPAANIMNPTIMVDGQPFCLGLWDTAGQDDYDRLRPLSYPQTNVFILCFSIHSRSSLEHIASKWIPEITKHCPNIPYLILRTKDDLKENDVIQCALNKRKNNLLVHGYLRNDMQLQQMMIPMDIWYCIEEYADAIHQFVMNEEGQRFCDGNGGYKYMTCSARDMKGVDEIFEEAVRCCIQRDYAENTAKCNSCLIL